MSASSRQVTPLAGAAGRRTPVQRRSRERVQQILIAAEQVVVAGGGRRADHARGGRPGAGADRDAVPVLRRPRRDHCGADRASRERDGRADRGSARGPWPLQRPKHRRAHRGGLPRGLPGSGRATSCCGSRGASTPRSLPSCVSATSCSPVSSTHSRSRPGCWSRARSHWCSRSRSSSPIASWRSPTGTISTAMTGSSAKGSRWWPAIWSATRRRRGSRGSTPASSRPAGKRRL